jgi:hypothetical protein
MHAVVGELGSACKQPTTRWTPHKFLLCVASNMIRQLVN